MSAFFARHMQNAVAALGRLSRQPVATLLTIGVIGIALALPAGLQLMVQGGQRLAGNWSDIRDFSVYLKPGASFDDAKRLARQLAEDEGILDVRLISADDALAELGDDPGFAEALRALEQNPLPHTLVVRPAADMEMEALDALHEKLAERSEVDLVQLDTQWLMRLAAILELLRRGILLVAVLLLAAVIFIVGNTIRLDIQNRRQEIGVSKLLGATDAFVRRPFLYIGFWYGLLGGLLAVFLLGIILLLLRGPLIRLLELYDMAFAGFGLGFTALLAVPLTGIIAGWAGAWLAVSRHLSAIEPRV